MEEIKEKEYIRTDKGSIWKVVVKTSTGVIVEDEKHIHYDTIKSHSLNIIDLIEVGDYVNGMYVSATYLEGERHYIKLNGLEGTRVYDENIKNVVTHEQFNSIKYEVE